jgi:predicted transcriptional regulator
MKDVNQIAEVSKVLGSAKRTLLLFIINEKPMSYTEIDKKFRKMEVKIGSSEVYKHLDILQENKYMAKKGKMYVVTLKGRKLIEGLEAVIDIPPTVPKLELVF